MALEIKVTCDCGQHYKFDVEPVDGLMPFPVNCPVCGVEGTNKANALIREALGASAPRPVAVAPSIRLATAAPAAPALAVPPPAPAPAARPAFLPGQARAAAKPAAEPCRFLPGVLGAIAGGIVGMLCWFWLIKLTHHEIGIVAWGVGLITGLGARLLARSGSQGLGIVAGACAFLAILGGEFLFVKSTMDKMLTGVEEMMTKAYDERVVMARDAVKVQTDAETRALLIKHGESEQPTAEEIKDFRENELPKLKELADGKPSKAEYMKEFREVGGTLTYLKAVKDSASIYTILWLLLGISTAYKIGEG